MAIPVTAKAVFGRKNTSTGIRSPKRGFCAMKKYRWRCAVFLCCLLTAGSASAEFIDDPLAAVETWVRLKGDTAGAVTYEWVHGTAYGAPDDASSQALFGIESVTVRQTRALPEGGYEERNFACRLYRDLQTGQYINQFINPFTNRVVELGGACNDGFAIRYTADSVDLLADLDIQSTALGRPMRLEVIDAGDFVSIRRASHSEILPKAAKESRRELAIDSFEVAAADFYNADISNLSVAYHWVSLAQWMPVLDMADIAGHMLWSVHGRKFGRVDELPEEFRRALEKRVPGALARDIVWPELN